VVAFAARFWRSQREDNMKGQCDRLLGFTTVRAALSEAEDSLGAATTELEAHKDDPTGSEEATQLASFAVGEAEMKVEAAYNR
jgi:hypothetical protein